MVASLQTSSRFFKVNRKPDLEDMEVLNSYTAFMNQLPTASHDPKVRLAWPDFAASHFYLGKRGIPSIILPDGEEFNHLKANPNSSNVGQLFKMTQNKHAYYDFRD